jgi:hypothetical protein
MIGRIMFAAAAFATLSLTPAARAGGERVGTSTEDAPNLKGAFVIHNSTNVPIHYQVKWGKGKWKDYTVKVGFMTTHSYPLTNGRAPVPLVRFDNVGGDGKVTHKMFEMDFGRVGYVGFGPVGHVNEAIHYHFRYLSGGRILDLFKR